MNFVGFFTLSFLVELSISVVISVVHMVLAHQDEILGAKYLRKLLKLDLCSCVMEKL